ncbi:MAG: serine--tRNA ligase [bacterium]
MLDINFIRQNPKLVKEGVKNKKVNLDIDEILGLDNQKRDLLKEVEDLRAKQKSFNDEIRDQKSETEKQKILEKMKDIKGEIQKLEEKLNEVADLLQEKLLQIPNIPLDDVKIGKDESDNEILREVGDIKKFDFETKNHIELGKDLDIIDIERATKISGSRFYFLKGDAALLEFALIQYSLKKLAEKDFTPVIPPVMVSEKAMGAMGFLSRASDSEEVYHFEKDNLYLVGTSEQSIGTMYLDEVLKEEELPKRYAGFSTCFRREAGSYGKDTKGILRVHQFDKLERFIFCKQEDSDSEHEKMLSDTEEMMKELGLPYRVLKLCTGDLGFASARTYDIETWIPSENKYRETHSISACGDFQSRRLNTKYKNKKTGKNGFVYTLNGTVFAIGRILIAILENYQNADGSITVPEVLRGYVGKDAIKK